ncbi:isochorismatase family cysteine hydrolase [Cupriavidus sp. 2SB]|uniref:isochorismatase family protein n=1 Tax=Cupriavidus sp. 2SB TaxID=2502199 RepID=UPI0010F6F654
MAKTLFVNGTLMRGLALHGNLAGAEFLGEFRTKPVYRIHSIHDIHPGMYRVEQGGVAVAGEMYCMSDETWARVEAGEPPHLYCGPVELEDGRVVDGILYPQKEITAAHTDISGFGDWRAYMASRTKTIEAEPYALSFTPATTALVIIDMQRDFLEPGGFGEMLGNDVSLLRGAIAPCKALLEAARARGMLVVHTREGHSPDLGDCPPTKLARGQLQTGIGDVGPMGRILVRGQAGHDIIPELYPIAGEPVIDKPGKGAFYATDFEARLRNRGIKTLIVCGVTTEVCVNTTVREGNDRGFECLVVSDATGSYFPEFQRVGLEMIKAQGGIFGWVASSAAVVAALEGRPA